MNQQSISQILEQEQSSPIKESVLSLKQKNSLNLKRWQIVSASLIFLLAGVGIGKYEPTKAPTQTNIETQVTPLPVETTQIQLAKTYQTVQSYTGGSSSDAYQ